MLDEINAATRALSAEFGEPTSQAGSAQAVAS
jgi:hypothetical protein